MKAFNLSTVAPVQHGVGGYGMAWYICTSGRGVCGQIGDQIQETLP